MRIVHVAAVFPPHMTGTSVVCLQDALAVARRGHDVTVVTADWPLDDWSDPPELTVRRLPPLFRIGNAPLLPGLLGLDNYDLIHLHHPFIFGAELVWALSRLRGVPYVLTHHNDLIGNGVRTYVFGAYTYLSRLVVPAGAAKLVVVSLDHARSCSLTPVFRHRPADVVEIPNAVDVDLFRPDLDPRPIRQQVGVPAGWHVLLFVAALDRAHHTKGLPRLLRALQRMRHRNVVLIVVGDGDLRASYEAEARRLGVAARVAFVGAVQHAQLPPYYAAADVLVLPSVAEPFGLVLIEAMACGRPVVAHDVPGARSIVTHAVDGLVVPLSVPEALAEALDTLLADPARRAQMGAAGRHKVCARYTWPAVGERLERLYEEVLAARRRPAPARAGPMPHPHTSTRTRVRPDAS